MKKENRGKGEPQGIEFQCKYCSKTVSTPFDTKDQHPPGWKCITKESDEGIENFYLCPDCMNRYRSGQAAYRND